MDENQYKAAIRDALLHEIERLKQSIAEKTDWGIYFLPITDPRDDARRMNAIRAEVNAKVFKGNVPKNDFDLCLEVFDNLVEENIIERGANSLIVRL